MVHSSPIKATESIEPVKHVIQQCSNPKDSYLMYPV